MLLKPQPVKIIKMSYTFQIIKYNFRRKYLNLNWREFSYQTTNTNIKSKIRNGSSFLVQFLENKNHKSDINSIKHGFCTRRFEKKTNLKPKLYGKERKLLPITSLHSYDPVYATVKPFTPTSDDILVLQDESELKGENNIISRNNYNVFVLSNPCSYQPSISESSIRYLPLTDFEKSMIYMAGKPEEARRTVDVTENKVWSGEKAKPEHLERIFNILSQNLPRFFTQAHDYSIYTADIEFNNNIRGTRSKGLASYVQQLALVRIVGHLKFAHVRFEVLKITKHPDDGTVRVRWRIRGITAFKAFFKIWNIKSWDRQKLLEEESDWYDGFSIFYIGQDGLVYRHDCDKMIPDEEKKIDTTQSLTAKLALILGTFQRPALEVLNTVLLAVIKMSSTNSASQSIVK